jgi:alpha-beta hydrolase superfamily lysophospholipase
MPDLNGRHEEDHFRDHLGMEIYYQAWIPDKPKATLTLLHGIGEHSGRYAHLTDHMTIRGFEVWACDLRGHGRSGGKRGHINSFDDYLDEIGLLIKMAKDRDPAKKVFLLGHSLGGLIAPEYALRNASQLTGLILSAPALRDKVKVPPAKAFLARILSQLAPTYSTTTGLDPNLLSRDPEVVRKYVEDPLVHAVATARFFTEFRRAQHETMRSADKITLPCLVLQGGADEIVDVSATSHFFEKLGSSDKTLKIYDGFYHEVLNEPDNESVINDIEAWMSTRT